MNEATSTETSDAVAGRFKPFVMRIWSERITFAIMLFLAVSVAPLMLWLAGFAFVAWVEAPIACGMIFVAVLWVLAEREIRQKESFQVKSLHDAGRYMFEVAKHLEELGHDGQVIMSNKDFEIHVKSKRDDA